MHNHQKQRSVYVRNQITLGVYITLINISLVLKGTTSKDKDLNLSFLIFSLTSKLQFIHVFKAAHLVRVKYDTYNIYPKGRCRAPASQIKTKAECCIKHLLMISLHVMESTGVLFSRGFIDLFIASGIYICLCISSPKSKCLA